MEWAMSKIFNSSQEIADSASFDNIRMYRVARMYSETEQDDLISEQWSSWADPSDAARLGEFSAVCFLFARAITQELANNTKVLVTTCSQCTLVHG